MSPTIHFMAEMESAINAPSAVRGIDVFRIADNLSVKLWRLFESNAIDDLVVHKIRRTTRWSVNTYDVTHGFGFEVKKDRWTSHGKKKIREIKQFSLAYGSVDWRRLVLSSVPGVSSIFEDSDGYRLFMTHKALFSREQLTVSQWKGCQLLRMTTDHLMDRSLENAYWRGMNLPPPDGRRPEMFVTCGNLIKWYRHLSGAHSAATLPHQLRAEKMPSGKFFVRPLYFSTPKEYFREILALKPIRKAVAALVLLLAADIYVSLGGSEHDFSCWLDCPKFDGTNACDLTTITSVPAPLEKAPENMFRQVPKLFPFIDERARGSLDGFFFYDPPSS